MDAVRSKAVSYVVLDSLFNVSSIVFGAFVLVFLFSTFWPSTFAIVLMGMRDRTGCVNLFFFLMSCY